MQATARGNLTQRIFSPLGFGILLGIFVIAAFPQVIFGLQTFVTRDYGFFAYPLAYFQRECFWHGELPLWNPYNQCGVPFLAQWNTMPLYPPALIYLTLPLEWSLSFFCLAHLWWAGLGMYFLARRWTGNDFAAAFAGTVFAFNGFTLNLLMWPSHVATFSWMPWVILAVELAWRTGGEKILLAALAGAFQMLAGGPETILFTWLIALALWTQQFVKSECPRSAMLWRFPLVIALVFLLSAAQLLPFLDLVHHAQRETGFADFHWSMPGWGWANFLVPMLFGYNRNGSIFFQYNQFWTSSYYLGVGTLLLGTLAIWQTRARRVWLLAAIALIGLFFALGDNTPVLPLVRKVIPQLSFITYPIKYVTLTIFALPLLAAFALANWENARKKLLPGGIIFLSFIVIILFWAAWFPFPTDDISATLVNGLSRAGWLILMVLLLAALARQIQSPLSRIAPFLLLCIVWVDLFTHEPNQNPSVQPWIYQPDLAKSKLAMQPQPELNRSRAMVSPMAWQEFIHASVSSPQNNFLAKRLGYCANVNLLDHVPKTDGFFSLSPHEYNDVLDLFYTTTNASFPSLETFMGVSQYTAPDQIYHWQARTNFLPLVTAGQKPIFLNADETLIALTQTNFDGRKVVFLPPEAKSLVHITNQTDARVINWKFHTQNAEVEVEAAEPSLVILSQTFYHDWQAYVDGVPAPVLAANRAFQAVQVPQGRHKIQLVYEDKAFQIGAAISICMWVNCLVIWALMRWRALAVKKLEAGEDALI